MKVISIELTDEKICEANTIWWKQFMSLFLKSGRKFEIRHWREEKEVVEKACTYGKISDNDSTNFEVSVKGTLTNAIIHELLKMDGLHRSHQMTEFFTINIADMVSSSHYGKEIYIFNPPTEVCKQLSTIFTPIKEYFTFDAWGE